MTEAGVDFRAQVLRWWLVPVAVVLGLLLPVNAICIGLVGAFFMRGDRAVARTLLLVAVVFSVVAFVG